MAMQRPERSLIFQQWEAGNFIWVISAEMLAQFKQVTERPRLARRIRPSARDALIKALWNRAVIVTPATESPACRDSGDDIVIATAVAAHANFIVTADKDLHDDEGLVTRLRDEFGIHVVQPYEFLNTLG
jgi:putative PIN family toxin of toxin-antitoxin system